MKNLSVALLLLCVLLACKKEKINILPEPLATDSIQVIDTNKVADTTYVIQGIADIKIRQLSTQNFMLDIVHLGGSQNKVSLSIANVPEGITASFTPAVGYAGFKTELSFKALVPQPGTYPITISASTDQKKTKTYNVQLEVEQVACDSFLFNYNNGFRTKEGNRPYIIYADTRITRRNNDDKYYFSSLVCEAYASTGIVVSYLSGDDRVSLVFDCDNHTIHIPQVNVSAVNTTTGLSAEYTISGSGTIDYYDSKINITYTTKDKQGLTRTFKMDSDISFE